MWHVMWWSCDLYHYNVVWSRSSCIHHHHQFVWYWAEYGWPWEALPDLRETVSRWTGPTCSLWGLWSSQGSCWLLPCESQMLGVALGFGVTLLLNPLPRHKLMLRCIKDWVQSLRRNKNLVHKRHPVSGTEQARDREPTCLLPHQRFQLINHAHHYIRKRGQCSWHLSTSALASNMARKLESTPLNLYFCPCNFCKLSSLWRYCQKCDFLGACLIMKAYLTIFSLILFTI